MVSIEETLKKLDNAEKFEGTERIKRCPLIHNGFEGNLNASLGEHPLLERQGGYCNFKKEDSFSVAQFCARNEDYYTNRDTKPSIIKSPEKYLGLFTMADITGEKSGPGSRDIDNLHYFQIQKTIEMFKDFGIDVKRIYPSVFKGAKVNEIRRNPESDVISYPHLEDYIERDVISEQALLDAGIPQSNIRYDNSRDTFLSLCFPFNKIGWGYRVEFDVEHKGKMIDLATNEYFKFMPIYKRELPDNFPLSETKDKISPSDIVGFKPIEFTAIANGTGVERLAMVSSDLDDIRKLPEFKRMYSSFGGLDKPLEYLRVYQAVCGDIVAHPKVELSRKDPKKLSGTKRHLLNKIRRNLIPYDNGLLRDVMEEHASAYHWIPELGKGIDYAINELDRYRIAVGYKK